MQLVPISVTVLWLEVACREMESGLEGRKRVSGR